MRNLCCQQSNQNKIYIHNFMDKKFVKFLEEILINHAQKITQFRDEIIRYFRERNEDSNTMPVDYKYVKKEWI